MKVHNNKPQVFPVGHDETMLGKQGATAQTTHCGPLRGSRDTDCLKNGTLTTGSDRWKHILVHRVAIFLSGFAADWRPPKSGDMKTTGDLASGEGQATQRLQGRARTTSKMASRWSVIQSQVKTRPEDTRPQPSPPAARGGRQILGG